MVHLLTFRPGFDEPSLSPFCVKAMILLDLAGQDWTPEWTGVPPKESFGKLPALRTSEGLVPDSNFILDWLDGQGADLFPGCNPKARAVGLAAMRLAEDSLRFGVVHDRWVRDDGWKHLKQVAFGGLPFPLSLVVPNLVRRGIVKLLHKQGIASFPEVDRLRVLQRDLETLEVLLGEQPWLMGDVPTAVDASVLPVLSMLDHLRCDTGLRRLMRSRSPLMRYVQRGREVLYSPIWARIGEAPGHDPNRSN